MDSTPSPVHARMATPEIAAKPVSTTSFDEKRVTNFYHIQLLEYRYFTLLPKINLCAYKDSRPLLNISENKKHRRSLCIQR